MNQRIKELAKQAGYNDQIYEICKEGLEKFAELIIKECKEALVNGYPPNELIPIEETIGCIKQHFGL